MTGKAQTKDLAVPKTMKAWVLDDPDQLRLTEKPVPEPGPAEVLVRIDAVAICGTDVEIITKGLPAMIQGGSPFNKNFTPGHEYMGTIVKLGAGVDEYKIGDRVAVEIHAGCGRCERCRQGMYTSCLNYGLNYGDHQKGHRANGFTTDGGFAQYAVNHINTLIHVPDEMSDAEATLIVTAGTAMYGLDVLGGLIAGESLVVTGPGPIGLMGVAVGKALGAEPVILTGTRDSRLNLGLKLGADHVVNVGKENPVEAVRTDHRRQGGQLRPGVFRGAELPERGVGHDPAGGPDLPGSLPRGAGAGRPGEACPQQRLPLRDPGRGEKRHPSRRRPDEPEKVRRQTHAHPYLHAGGGPKGLPILPRKDRRRDQGGNQSLMRHSRYSVIDLNITAKSKRRRYGKFLDL